MLVMFNNIVKKYLVIILFTIITATVIQTIYQKEKPSNSEWIESCYGINCVGFTSEPIPPRSDWGWSNDYCSNYYWKEVEMMPELKELIEPDCYI